jgi:hypothetical protein
MVCRSMCASNSASLLVSYTHIAMAQSQLAIWLTDQPQEMLQILNDVLKAVVRAEFPNYFNVSIASHLLLLYPVYIL